MDWDQLVQLTVSGLTNGSMYALIALGFSIVYGILKLLNFAHGDVFMIGAFIGYFTLIGLEARSTGDADAAAESADVRVRDGRLRRPRRDRGAVRLPAAA